MPMKPIAEMSRDEIMSEIDWMQSYFDDCAASGQGISSKEGIRFRDLKKALFNLVMDELVTADILRNYNESADDLVRRVQRTKFPMFADPALPAYEFLS